MVLSMGLYEMHMNLTSRTFIEVIFQQFLQPRRVLKFYFHFPGKEKSQTLLKMTKVIEKSRNFEKTNSLKIHVHGQFILDFCPQEKVIDMNI